MPDPMKPNSRPDAAPHTRPALCALTIILVMLLSALLSQAAFCAQPAQQAAQHSADNATTAAPAVPEEVLAPAPAPEPEPDAPPASNATSPQQANSLERASQTLEGLDRQIKLLNEDIATTRAAIPTAADAEERQALETKLTGLKAKLQDLQSTFEEVATGVDLQAFYQQPNEELNWSQELQTLVGPIIMELRSLTERPREIDRLQRQLEALQAKLPTIQQAIARLDKAIAAAPSQEVRDRLQGLRDNWSEHLDDANNMLSLTHYQLEQKQESRDSVFTSLQNFIQSFFKSRGKNLLLSILAFVVVFLGLRILYRRALQPSRAKRKSFAVRLFEILYQLVAFLAAVAAAMVMLYLSGDWVLLGLAIIFLLGLAWAAKETLPRMWQETKLLLNLGAVRERERLVVDGIPYEVKSLAFYSYLNNPRLKGGYIRLPLKALMDRASRPFDPSEPWFPTSPGDWVLLGDGTFGQVRLQTPELVQMAVWSNSVKTYSATDFMGQTPLNISEGFGICTTFGIDYAHQAECTTTVPRLMQEFLEAKLELDDLRPHLRFLRVDFKTAGASSLDYIVLAEFAGAAAPRFRVIERIFQRMCVDAANQYGWGIPFTQVTIHQAGQTTPTSSPEQPGQPSSEGGSEG